MFQGRSSISLLAKSLSVFAAVIMLASCGFKPLYAKQEKDGQYTTCKNFVVAKMKDFGVSGQRMQYKLQDSLNQACINPDKDYRVTIDMTKSRDATAIQKDREVTRYNLTFNALFSVIDTATDKEVYHGNSSMVGGFDAQVSDYGTYALEEDTEKKLLEEMANDITLKISTVLLRKK